MAGDEFIYGPAYMPLHFRARDEAAHDVGR